MKIEMSKNGMLKIKAESEIEVYALNKWGDDNFNGNISIYMEINCTLNE